MFGDRGLGRDAVEALADRDADVVVVDCLLFGVMDELTRAGRRYVVLEHLYDAYLTGGWMKGPMGLGMRLKRLHPTRALQAAQLRLVTSVPSLDPAGGRSGLTYVGPVCPSRPSRTVTPTPNRWSWSASAPTASHGWPSACRRSSMPAPTSTSMWSPPRAR